MQAFVLCRFIFMDMKNLLTALLLLPVAAFGQVQINKPLELTGSGLDARVMGIDTVADAKDAVNVKTLQSGRLLYNKGAGSGQTHDITLPHFTGVFYDGMIVTFRANHGSSGQQDIKLNGTTYPLNTTHSIEVNTFYQIIFSGYQWYILSKSY